MFDDRMQHQLEVARMKNFPAMGGYLLPMTYKHARSRPTHFSLLAGDAPKRHQESRVTEDSLAVTSLSLDEDEEDEEEDESESIGLNLTKPKAQKSPHMKGDANRRKDKMELKSFLYDKKTFHCQHCKYVTDRKNNLKRHIATMHEKCGKLLECCDTIFANKAVLREHVISNHKHGYDCRVCGRNFCRKALLKRHVTVHSGQKDYKCQTCGYATSHKSNLDRHKKRHLPKESRSSHRFSPMTHAHPLSIQLPKYTQQNPDFLTMYHEAYSDFLDGRIEHSAASPLRLSSSLTSELQIQTGSRPYSDKGFFKKRLMYMFENRQDDIDLSDAPESRSSQNGQSEERTENQTDSSDSGSESPRDMLPSRETDTTESPFVSPTNTDSPDNSFDFPVFSSGETSPNSLDLSDMDTYKVRLFPRLHRCKKCDRVFQNQLQLDGHATHAHALSMWAEARNLRPLTVQFRKQDKIRHRLPAFLFT